MFKQRKNKKFGYNPRFQNSKEFKENEDFEAKWKGVRQNSKRKSGAFKTLPVMVVMLIAVVVLMYILNGYTK